MWREKKIFEELTPFSLLDFKNITSAILWFSRCNMRCDFCYNPELVFSKGKHSFKEYEEFFLSRQKLLQGVVLCGGEPTIHNEIYEVCKKLKEWGFKIKLDTNGLKPQMVKKLIDAKLLDYIALDFKAPKYKFEELTKSPTNQYESFLKTLEILINSKINFEVRTTYHSKLLSKKDINHMLDLLQEYKYKKEYFLQAFINDIPTIGDVGFSENMDIKKSISKKYDFKINYRNFY